MNHVWQLYRKFKARFCLKRVKKAQSATNNSAFITKYGNKLITLQTNNVTPEHEGSI